MPSPIFISRPPPGFTLWAVVRGAQLTVLGGYRALRNPDLLKTGYYKKAIQAVILSVIIQYVIWLPLILYSWSLYLIQAVVGGSTELDQKVRHLQFWQDALNIGPLIIATIRYVRPEMDDLFLVSLRFVDQVYKNKHPGTTREYYPALIRYDVDSKQPAPEGPKQHRDNFRKFLRRSAIRAITSIVVYYLSDIPVIGGLVLPAATFPTINEIVGTPIAVSTFALGMFVPKKCMMRFLASLWGSRSLCRELLSPYFNRIPFSKSERDRWFTAREGIMFGFGFAFYYLLKIPFLGVLIYGFAEASAAYLITKVSDPPPNPSQLSDWTVDQTVWTHKEQAEVIEGKKWSNDGF